MKIQDTTRGRRIGLGSAIGTTLLAVAIGFAASGAGAADAGADDTDTTRAALEQWVETRRLISKEKREFAEGQQALEDRVELLQREIDSLHERTREAEASIADADKQREELFAESEALKAASAVFAETAAALETRTKELLGRMPEPVTDKVKSLLQRIPEDPADSKLSLSERFLSVVGILNEVERFNREITLTSEVHELPNGTTAEVAVMYVGLGHAYYVTNSGDHAGIGTSTPEGWTWRGADESAVDIALAIDILKNKAIAQYVKLPIALD